jgi:hypothetical protein
MPRPQRTARTATAFVNLSGDREHVDARVSNQNDGGVERRDAAHQLAAADSGR